MPHLLIHLNDSQIVFRLWLLLSGDPKGKSAKKEKEKIDNSQKGYLVDKDHEQHGHHQEHKGTKPHKRSQFHHAIISGVHAQEISHIVIARVGFSCGSNRGIRACRNFKAHLNSTELNARKMVNERNWPTVSPIVWQVDA